jgi:hypothetical protein
VLDCGAPGQNTTGTCRLRPLMANGMREGDEKEGGPRLRAISETISSDCEPVHICSAWALLSSCRWGFQGPSDRRRRDTPFRARRRNFSKLVLSTRLLSLVLCLARPCQPTTVSHQPSPVALWISASAIGCMTRIHDVIPIHFRALIQRPANRYVGRERPEAFPP